MHLHSQLERLAIANGSFHSIRLLVGGIHTVYLLSIGVSLSEIAKLQIVYSIAVLLLEFPSGYLSDLGNKKKLVLASAAFLAIYFIILTSSPSLRILYVAEIIYALSLTSISGSFEGWVRDKTDGCSEKYRKVAHRWLEYQALFGAVSGVFGILVAYYFSNFAISYLAAALLCLIPFMLFASIPNDPAQVGPPIPPARESQNIWRVVKSVTGSKNWWRYTLLAALFSAAIQVLYHFWQPIVTSDDGAKGIYSFENAVYLSSLFGLTFIAQYLANRWVRVTKSAIETGWILAMIASCLALIVFLSDAVLSETPGAFALTFLSLLLLFGVSSALPPFFQSYLVGFQEPSVFASAFSLSELVARIGSIVALALTAMVATEEVPSQVFIVPTIFFALLSLTMKVVSSYPLATNQK